MEWHKKMEEIRLQELRNARELVAQKEENQYLKNLVAEQERSISSLEQDIVQQNMVGVKFRLAFQHSIAERGALCCWGTRNGTTIVFLFFLLKSCPCLCGSKRLDEQQLFWDQREVELERQLDQYEKHQSDVISRTGKVGWPLHFIYPVLLVQQPAERWIFFI